MSDTAIFVVGVFTFLLLSGGVGFTFLEVRRIEGETKAKRRSGRLSVPRPQRETD
jgi:hypothetical protein